jgi:glycosyltransferase involved in cell wall biosynthesis
MKILYHHRIRSKDGQFVHLSEMVQALRTEGHHVDIVGPRVVEDGAFGAEAGWTDALRRNVPRAVYELLEFGYSILDFWRLAASIRRNRPDVIYERYNLFLPSGVWASRLFRLPLLLEVNAPLFDERSRFGRVALRRLARWSEVHAWRAASMVLPVTRVLADRVCQAGVPSGRIMVVPNGINGQEFTVLPPRDEAKQALGLAGRFVIGFVGFMREWHGLERVLDVIAGASRADLHAVFVGDGPARQAVMSHARDLGIEAQVTITGIVDRERVPAHLAAFDVAMQPAVVEYASPLKIFEYLAVGLPIIAPDTPNIREVLADGHNALLFDPAAEGGFAVALRRLCDDGELRERLGRAARETIERRRLTWNHNARTVGRLVEQFSTARGALR